LRSPSRVLGRGEAQRSHSVAGMLRKLVRSIGFDRFATAGANSDSADIDADIAETIHFVRSTRRHHLNGLPRCEATVMSPRRRS
jgi:hypothetical protein